MATIYPIGEPGNDAERKAIRRLNELLPDEYALFHNFEATTRRGFPYEVDILVMGSHALYLLEVKGYKGRINGDASRWRLQPSGASHANPIPLANTKCRVLHDKLADKDRAVQGTLVVALIVLSDDRVKVGNLRDDRRDRVMLLDECAAYIQDPRRLPLSKPKSIQHLHKRLVSLIAGSAPAHKTTEIGLYDIVEKINQTDRRTVYLAKHRYLKTRPKTVLQVYHFDPYLKESERLSQIESIFHEQEAMSQLSVHPNIIKMGDVFPWEGNVFVVPHEFIESGQTLRMLLDAGDEELSWAQKRRIISGTARGLRHAHKHDVIHRDIRPLNIVVEPSSEVVKLVNFDLAMIQGSARISDWAGLEEELDPCYTAPEVWENLSKATESSDIYSLGLVFYELLTGQKAQQDVATSLEQGRVDIDPAAIIEALAEVKESAGDVAQVIERMCQVDPEKRYPSVGEVIEDLSIIGD